jgi:tripartite-type tricarboxylate transporter receptor subunit TctC
MRALAAALFCALAASTAVSQDYPTKPITLVVPFPEKVGGDLLARPFAEKLATGLGQPINVQNVPGKSGSVGVAQGAKAPPDGYTLIFSGDAALTTNAIIFEAMATTPDKTWQLSHSSSPRRTLSLFRHRPLHDLSLTW